MQIVRHIHSTRIPLLQGKAPAQLHHRRTPSKLQLVKTNNQKKTKSHTQQPGKDPLIMMIESDTQKSILDAYRATIQYFELHADTLSPNFKDAINKLIENMHHIQAGFESWVRARLSDSASSYRMMTQHDVQSVYQHRIEELINAGSEELSWQLNFQKHMEKAVNSFKSMLVQSGFQHHSELKQSSFYNHLIRTNPVNLVDLFSPIVVKLSKGNASIEWLLYRVFNTQLLTHMIKTYANWPPKLQQELKASHA